MTASSPWLASLRPATAPAVRLICVPHAGGGASVFRRWGPLLPEAVDLLAVQLPGRQSRYSERPESDLGRVVEAVAEGVEPLLDVPIALFGHSVGAIVAFELARTLSWQSLVPPAHLFVAGCASPRRVHASGAPRSQDLSDEDFVGMLGTVGGLPAEVLANRDLLDLLLPALRADCQLYETYEYRPGPQLRCPISVIAGRDDSVPLGDLEDWSSESSVSSSVRLFPGGHFFTSEQEAAVVAEVAASLKESLGAVA